MASSLSFFQVISYNGSRKEVLSLRNRCLIPGLYAQHLEKWLNFFPPSSLFIVDGDEVRGDPVSLMNRLQSQLKIDPFVDYSSLLRFDAKKGFFCPVLGNNKTRCLGRSKGRRYPDMDVQSIKYLKDFYLQSNIALSKLLTRLRQNIPLWLQRDLSSNSLDADETPGEESDFL
jgi:heparan sulfate N-deacetylase/N-sulfotransferase NDST2